MADQGFIPLPRISLLLPIDGRFRGGDDGNEVVDGTWLNAFVVLEDHGLDALLACPYDGVDLCSCDGFMAVEFLPGEVKDPSNEGKPEAVVELLGEEDDERLSPEKSDTSGAALLAVGAGKTVDELKAFCC